MGNENWESLLPLLPKGHIHSVVDAAVSFKADIDNGVERSIFEYAKKWGWRWHRTKNFIAEIKGEEPVVDGSKIPLLKGEENMGTEFKKKLGKKIREIRGKSSQFDFAKKINSSQMLVSLYELGKTKPSLKTLLSIAQYADVSVDFLLTGKDPSGEIKYYSPEERDYIEKLVKIFRRKNLNAKKLIQSQIDVCICWSEE